MSEHPTIQAEEKLPTWSEVVCGNCPMWERFPWDEKCEGCKDTHDSHRGLCRINPPKLDHESGKGYWPVTQVDDWCGPGRDLVMGVIAEQQAKVDSAPRVWYKRYMTRPALLAWLLIILNFVDAILTVWAIANGGGEVQEANPMMAALLAAGPMVFVAVKTAIGAALAVYLWRKRPQSPVLWAGPLIVAGVLVWNVLRLNFG